MKVREIIEQLQNLDPELDVLIVHDGSAFAIDGVCLDDGLKYGERSGFEKMGVQPFVAISTDW